MRISGVNQSPVAGGHDRAVVTQRNELLVEGVHRIRIIEFTGGVDLGMIRIHGNPWLSGGVRSGETGVAGTVPLHRSTRVVTAARGQTGHH